VGNIKLGRPQHDVPHITRNLRAQSELSQGYMIVGCFSEIMPAVSVIVGVVDWGSSASWMSHNLKGHIKNRCDHRIASRNRPTGLTIPARTSTADFHDFWFLEFDTDRARNFFRTCLPDACRLTLWKRILSLISINPGIFPPSVPY